MVRIKAAVKLIANVATPKPRTNFFITRMWPDAQKLGDAAGDCKSDFFSCHMPLVTFNFPVLAAALG